MAKLKVLLSFNMKLIPTCSKKRFTLGFPLAPTGLRALTVTLGSRKREAERSSELIKTSVAAL
jgi:hypothetical protein